MSSCLLDTHGSLCFAGLVVCASPHPRARLCSKDLLNAGIIYLPTLPSSAPHLGLKVRHHCLYFVGEAVGGSISDHWLVLNVRSRISILLQAEGRPGDWPVTFHPAQPRALLDLSHKAEKSETVPRVSHTTSLKEKTEGSQSRGLQNFAVIPPLRGNSGFRISMRMAKARIRGWSIFS